MFLRRNRRTYRGEIYEYWSLLRTVRTIKGPRHKLVANLGKAPELDPGMRHGWEHIADLLEGRESKSKATQGELGQPWPPSAPASAAWAEVDLRSLRVERVRDFGQAYLALALWRRLGLHTLLRELIKPGREEVPWELVACILTVARFCGNKSELEVAERWYAGSALEDLLGVPFGRIHHMRLYRGLDVLHEHKERLCQHLLERYQSWFGVEFEFLLYDVTSTYFEGKAEDNAKAARGYSRDQRPDCKQVNIGLVVTPEGLPIGYEVFAGNTADVTTVEDMVEMMERKYGQARRIWVMDRGMVSEENLDFLRQRQARYIVGAPKGQLKTFEAELLDAANWSEVQPGVEVKLAEHPDGGGQEQYVLCRSTERRNKEAAMLEQQRQRLMAKLEKTGAALGKRPAKDPGQIERRIGRWLGRYPGAEKLVEVTVLRDGAGRACGLEISGKEERQQWAQLAHGAYLLRTNCTEKDPAQLWRWYIHLTQAEECFKISKSDLSLRPVFHQRTERVEAHILVCFLTLTLWRTLEPERSGDSQPKAARRAGEARQMWMKSKGLGDCARQLIKEVSTIRSMDVVLQARPTPQAPSVELRLRVVARPDKMAAELLQHLGLELPGAPKMVQNVVPKITP